MRKYGLALCGFLPAPIRPNHSIWCVPMTANFKFSDVQATPLVGGMADLPLRPRHFANGRIRPLEAPRRSFYGSFGKRMLDIMLVLCALPVVLPVIVLLVLLVAMQGGSPIYVQERVGLGGRTFRMFKLRTMVRDADACLAAHLAADPMARNEWNLRQKLTHDPRITLFGGFLRRSSLDELPQLWNVLKGDMSLVGPRPMMTAQRDFYPGRAYYRLRPGLTGPWQIGARHLTTFADRALFDDDYEVCHGFVYDMGIMLRTVRVVAKGSGC